MKRYLLLYFLFFFLSSSPFAQTFTLSDKVFRGGSRYVASRIYFERGKWDLLPQSYPELDSIVNFLKNNTQLNIQVEVHTDSRVSDSYSLCLSCKRAQTITDYLITNGIDANNLMAMGYQGTAPRVIETDVSFMKKGDVITDDYISKLETEEQKEEAHQMNRRVELKIIKIEPRYFKLTDTVFNVGDMYIADKIHFDFNLNTLLDESTIQLDSIVSFMNKNTKLVIEISGHVDSHGSDDYNMELSRARARRVMQYLVKKGIRKKRLTAIGYGETKPIALNEQPGGIDNPDGRQLNRRIELKILKVE